jgi:tRNA(fMet)-specific endonuclease VapC
MDKSLWDTDIISEFFKKKNEKALEKVDRYLSFYPRLTISNITIIEVITGFKKIHQEQKAKDFEKDLKNIDILYLDYESTLLSTKIEPLLRENGIQIGMNDIYIASIAIVNDLTVITGNVEHFKYIQSLGDKLGYDLEIDNWRD